MKKTNTIILYHAYGLKDLYNGVVFSMLTLAHHLDGKWEGIQVVVYTDNPKVFQPYAAALPLSIETLTPQNLQQYKGSTNFVHRVKICVIDDCFNKYKCNILYLDSDTYFTNSPLSLLEKISKETSIMNSNDYDLTTADDMFENKDWLLIRRTIRSFEYEVDNKKTKIPLTTRMWNAGVIGISYENSHLIQEVLNLTDQIYANRPVFTAEQFAFSYVLQNKTTLITSGDVIFHYWYNFFGMYWKDSYNYHLRQFFKSHQNKTVAQQASEAYDLTTQHNELMKLPVKTTFQKLRGRLKAIIKVARHGKLDK